MMPRSTFQNFRAWHVYNKGVFPYESSQVTLDGLVIRGRQPETAACCGMGIDHGDYLADGFIVRNADIQGMMLGIQPSSHDGRGSQLIENSYLRNHANIAFQTLFRTGNNADAVEPRLVEIRNVVFAAPPPVGVPYYTISTYFTTNLPRNLIQSDRIKVTSYNGVPGDDFWVYYLEQAPNFIVPETFPGGAMMLRGAPVPGLTNAQTWAQYNIAIAGGVAPCAVTRPNIAGFVCAQAPPEPPTNPTPPPPPGPPTPPPPPPPTPPTPPPTPPPPTPPPPTPPTPTPPPPPPPTPTPPPTPPPPTPPTPTPPPTPPAPPPTPPPPGQVRVDCVVSSWSEWWPWSSWVPSGNQEIRTRTRTRTIITAPSNGGAACGALSETETETRPLNGPPQPTPPAPPEDSVITRFLEFLRQLQSIVHLLAEPGTGVQLVIEPMEGGTVFGLGLACGETADRCVADLVPNAQVYLFALPAPGFDFVGWGGSGCDGTMVMDQPRTCRAFFERR
jgi:hypothetical protein